MDLKSIEFPKLLESTRLRLRPLEERDREALFAIYSDEQSAALDDWVPFTSVAEADALIRSAQEKAATKEELRLGIETTHNGRLVGSCGLFGFDEWNSKCMLYYQVCLQERNNGYATEAVAALIDYAFGPLGANRVEAYITPGNDASIRVLEKCGFANEGLLREMEFYKGRFWDGIAMAKLRRDHDTFARS